MRSLSDDLTIRESKSREVAARGLDATMNSRSALVPRLPGLKSDSFGSDDRIASKKIARRGTRQGGMAIGSKPFTTPSEQSTGNNQR